MFLSDGTRIPCAEMRPLVSHAMHNGWRVTLTKGGHLRFADHNGHIVIAAGTPGTKRSLQHTKSLLRRYGLQF